ncbi:initiator tRNA phosphoribosyl transferase-domain-containing protein [Clohesyomyces aquaticus]|uniref:Initiator tRNA phosphoribosyl transferase-domain-containing protein n=1 Tax=Clohesyomyces aquaticus TaxID=1231657 RepID=A0A1Y2A6H2_9PLEO|nr:initiator tRNA phosphoribosyl transferase-domain-containing protein [Clohesyomyces aquaticus]
MARPLTASDLIFSSQSQSLSATLHSLKRSTLSIHNRLKSISDDSVFVLAISEAYHGLPLVANERCGSWYIPLERKTSSAYFKSTDGHMNEWSFNLRRLNLQILDIIAANGGCVIVDSTRRGKSMPDALSKTIPIWCCVLNRAIFPRTEPHPLHTSAQAVSPSEHAQIESRIDGFVKQFLEVCKPDIQMLAHKLKKPLRPIWVTQQTKSHYMVPPAFEDFNTMVLCTASRRVHGGEGSEGDYVQGAADDHEAWARGLTPGIFWKNQETLMSTNEEDLPDLIAKLVREEKGSDAAPIKISRTSDLFISSTENLNIEPFDAVISCTPEPLRLANLEHLKGKYLYLPCGAGKLGSRDLRTQLLHLPSFIEGLPAEVRSILVCCTTGKDLSVGVALAILCLYTNDKGSISQNPIGNKIDKSFIKQRLAWITASSPTLNPSRGTLTALNTFLMPDASTKIRLIHKNPTPSTPETSDKPVVDLPPNAASQLPIQEPENVAKTPATEALPPPIPESLFSHLINHHQPWSFTRTLISALPTHPSGTVHGTATFTPFSSSSTPTATASSPSSSPSPPATYLYTESGIFKTTTHLEFTVRQSYIYRLTQPSLESGTEISNDDEAIHSEPYINVHFLASPETASAASTSDGIGGLFVEMGKLKPEDNGTAGDRLWEARNRETHLCGRDLYTACWRFGSGMIAEIPEAEGKCEGDLKERDRDRENLWWEVKYDAKGPKKDYVSETRYTLM